MNNKNLTFFQSKFVICCFGILVQYAFLNNNSFAAGTDYGGCSYNIINNTYVVNCTDPNHRLFESGDCNGAAYTDNPTRYFYDMAIQCRKGGLAGSKIYFKILSCRTSAYYPIKLGVSIYSIYSIIGSEFSKMNVVGNYSLTVQDMIDKDYGGCISCPGNGGEDGNIKFNNQSMILTQDPGFTGAKSIKNCVLYTPQKIYHDDTGDFKIGTCSY